MRPAILHWKVWLALFAVVLVAVTLGSVLHSSPKPANSGYVTKVNLNLVPNARIDVPIPPGMRLASTRRMLFTLEPHRSPLDRFRAWLVTKLRK